MTGDNLLFHVSDRGDIRRFDPRPSPYANGPVVWGIDDAHLRNYLLPRECPRVTFAAGSRSVLVQRQRLLGESAAVVAIETAWLDRVREARLFRYDLSPKTFELLDERAGYYVSHVPVAPLRVEPCGDLIAELQRRGVELRVLPDLWALHDDVARSTLEFSMIRMRNACPRPTPVLRLHR